MDEKLISIIIAARNGALRIKNCLDSISHLHYSNYEVIVVNDGSTDKTQEILNGYQNIKVINTLGLGPSGARNLAIKEARGEFIAFTDADCLVDPEWLNALISGFNDQAIAGTGGLQLSPVDDSPFGKNVQGFFEIFGFVSDYMKSGKAHRQVEHNPTCNSMYRKSVLLEMDGFHAGLWPGEDVELDYRIRKKRYLLGFTPKAIVFHYRASNYKKFAKMIFRYGLAQGWLVKRYGFFRPIQLIPIFSIILCLLLLFNVFWFALLIVLLFSVILVKSIRMQKDPSSMLFLFVLAVFAWNLGFFSSLPLQEIYPPVKT